MSSRDNHQSALLSLSQELSRLKAAWPRAGIKRERELIIFSSIAQFKTLPNDAKHAVSSLKMLWLKSRMRYDCLPVMTTTLSPIEKISKFSERYSTFIISVQCLCI